MSFTALCLHAGLQKGPLRVSGGSPRAGRRNGSDNSSFLLCCVPDNSSEPQTDNGENVLNKASLRIKVGGVR